MEEGSEPELSVATPKKARSRDAIKSSHWVAFKGVSLAREESLENWQRNLQQFIIWQNS